MTRPTNTLFKTLLLAAMLAGLARSAAAFALLGPFKSWQVTALGYQLPGDIGGPMLGNEGYRWNLPTIHYAFDQSFLTYFGKPGVAAVEAALKMFSDLPKFSDITNDGSSLYIGGEPVPTDVRGPQNFSLGEAGLFDVKSTTMQLMCEELGLAEATRWTWTLRGRLVVGAPPVTNYSVVKLNYDPITLAPTAYVNGQLYNYEIFEPIMLRGTTYAEAQETLSDPAIPYAFSAVADRVIGAGEYFFSLSHDDVGGLKYLYNKNNFASEQLLPGAVAGTVLAVGNRPPWSPYIGLSNIVANTNITINLSTNLIVTGLRPGINKLKFKRVNYDSLFGQFFRPITDSYNDVVLTNSGLVLQPVNRVLVQPDLIFVAEDLGLVVNLVPFQASRTATAAWANNDALNGNDGITGDQLGGPGVITPQIRISFSDQLPYWLNFSPDFLTGTDDPPASAVWASFDENTEVPVIYPLWLNLTLEDIQRLGR